MYKALCVAALMVGVLALTGRNSSASPAPLTSPLIVAKGKLVNQTAEIPQTTIYTPSATGLYRLNAYMVETSPISSQGVYWSFNLLWTDDGGAQSNGSNMYLAAIGGF